MIFKYNSEFPNFASIYIQIYFNTYWLMCSRIIQIKILNYLHAICIHVKCTYLLYMMFKKHYLQLSFFTFCLLLKSILVLIYIRVSSNHLHIFYCTYVNLALISLVLILYINDCVIQLRGNTSIEKVMLIWFLTVDGYLLSVGVFSSAGLVGAASPWWSNEGMMVYFKLMLQANAC